MKYRIRIMRNENGKRVFDHYATDEEMETLRVNSAGKVEELLYDPSISFEPCEMGLEHGYGYANIKIWQDVSDTHEVEWGVKINGKEYYEGDKTRCDTDSNDDSSPTYCYGEIVFRDGCFYEHTAIEDTPIEDIHGWIDVIGNVWENPELVEK